MIRWTILTTLLGAVAAPSIAAAGRSPELSIGVNPLDSTWYIGALGDAEFDDVSSGAVGMTVAYAVPIDRYFSFRPRLNYVHPLLDRAGSLHRVDALVGGRWDFGMAGGDIELGFGLEGGLSNTTYRTSGGSESGGGFSIGPTLGAKLRISPRHALYLDSSGALTFGGLGVIRLGLISIGVTYSPDAPPTPPPARSRSRSSLAVDLEFLSSDVVFPIYGLRYDRRITDGLSLEARLATAVFITWAQLGVAGELPVAGPLSARASLRVGGMLGLEDNYERDPTAAASAGVVLRRRSGAFVYAEVGEMVRPANSVLRGGPWAVHGSVGVGAGL